MNQSHKNIGKYQDIFFEKVKPYKLTEGRKLQLQSEGWGLLTDFYLESIKINKQKEGGMASVATLKIADRTGQVTCIAKGPTVGLLFGLTAEEWSDVEKLNMWSQQLFYRYFKNGLKNNFSFEQKLLYYFCMSNQKRDVLIAVFRRGINFRNVDRNDAVLEILELRKSTNHLLDLYLDGIRKRIIT